MGALALVFVSLFSFLTVPNLNSHTGQWAGVSSSLTAGMLHICLCLNCQYLGRSQTIKSNYQAWIQTQVFVCVYDLCV